MATEWAPLILLPVLKSLSSDCEQNSHSYFHSSWDTTCSHSHKCKKDSIHLSSRQLTTTLHATSRDTRFYVPVKLINNHFHRVRIWNAARKHSMGHLLEKWQKQETSVCSNLDYVLLDAIVIWRTFKLQLSERSLKCITRHLQRTYETS